MGLLKSGFFALFGGGHPVCIRRISWFAASNPVPFFPLSFSLFLLLVSLDLFFSFLPFEPSLPLAVLLLAQSFSFAILVLGKLDYPEVLSSFPIPHEILLTRPKGVEKGDQLLWMHQADTLAKDLFARKGRGGVRDNCFILAGPSGVGKSCLALSVAMYMRSIGETVLYLYDAVNLLAEGESDALYHGQKMSTHKALSLLLS